MRWKKAKIVCVNMSVCVPAPGLAQCWVAVPSQRGESGDKVKHGREESEPRLKPRTDNTNREIRPPLCDDPVQNEIKTCLIVFLHRKTGDRKKSSEMKGVWMWTKLFRLWRQHDVQCGRYSKCFHWLLVINALPLLLLFFMCTRLEDK